MRKILILLILIIPLMVMGQNGFDRFMAVVDTNICVQFEVFSEWENTSGNTAIGHYHNWKYAERCEVNDCASIVGSLALANLNGCGLPKSEIEARVCNVCFLHQKRIHTWGFEYRKNNLESEYLKILNINKQ